jgi:hypothetical protein
VVYCAYHLSNRSVGIGSDFRTNMEARWVDECSQQVGMGEASDGKASRPNFPEAKNI